LWPTGSIYSIVNLSFLPSPASTIFRNVDILTLAHAKWFESCKRNDKQAIVAGSPQAPFNEHLGLLLEKGLISSLVLQLVVMTALLGGFSTTVFLIGPGKWSIRIIGMLVAAALLALTIIFVPHRVNHDQAQTRRNAEMFYNFRSYNTSVIKRKTCSLIAIIVGYKLSNTNRLVSDIGKNCILAR
jgi:hypothetical protein